MKQEVKIGQTDYTVLILIRDTAGAPKTGLTNASAGIDVCYTRVETDNDVVLTAGAPVALATPALTDVHLDWGFLEVDATNAPGLYRLDIADGVFASGAWSAVVSLIATGIDPCQIEFILVPSSPYVGVQLDPAQGATTLASLTVTGATTLTGNVALADGLTVAAPSTADRAGITITGNGAGSGIKSTGGATNGNGMTLIGGATNGLGLYSQGTGAGTGIRGDGGATGHGIYGVGSGNGHGMIVTGAGTGHGIQAGGGATGHGISAAGGATSGSGITAIASTLGNGLTVTGAGTGDGLAAKSGNGATGSGISATADATNGAGINTVGKGSGAGIQSAGGLTGNGMGSTGGGTSGHGVYAKAAGTGNGLSCHGGGVAGDGVYAIGDNDGDGITAVGAGAGQYDVNADIHGVLDTVTTCTTTTTNTDIGALGIGLSAIPWNAAWDAEVQSECDDAITANLLILDIPSTAEFNARTIVSADYTVVGDTIAAVTTVGTVTGAITDKTGYALSATGADLVACDVAVVGAAPATLIHKIQAIWNRGFTNKSVTAILETSKEKDNATTMETWDLSDDDTTAARAV